VLTQKCDDCHPAWTQLLDVVGTGAGLGGCGQAGFAVVASLLRRFVPALKAESLDQCFCNVKFLLNVQKKTKCCSVGYGVRERLGDADWWHSQMQNQERL